MQHPWLHSYDSATPHTLAYPEVTLDQLLDCAARDYPDHTAITFVLKYALGNRVRIGGRMSYHQLRQRVDRLAAALDQLGVRKGERVAVIGGWVCGS